MQPPSIHPLQLQGGYVFSPLFSRRDPAILKVSINGDVKSYVVSACPDGCGADSDIAFSRPQYLPHIAFHQSRHHDDPPADGSSRHG